MTKERLPYLPCYVDWDKTIRFFYKYGKKYKAIDVCPDCFDVHRLHGLLPKTQPS